MLHHVTTENMQIPRRRRHLTFDMLALCAKGASRATDWEVRQMYKVLYGLCRLYVPDMCENRLIGFRRATLKESRASRFHEKLVLHRARKSVHLMLLMKTSQEQNVQYMFSASINHLHTIECIDIDKVYVIRFLLWLGKELLDRLTLGPDFFSVWIDRVIPEILRDVKASRSYKVRTRRWEGNNLTSE